MSYADILPIFTPTQPQDWLLLVFLGLMITGLLVTIFCDDDEEDDL